jgi:hypothetical protein
MTNNNVKTKFYWDEDTINYYANFEETNGWANTAMKIYEYVADECEWEDETDMRAAYLNLLEQVEEEIYKQIYNND